MRVPLSWLRDFVPVDVPVERLVAVLDELGLPVESVTRIGEGLDGVLVARVRSIEPVEGADRIRLVTVDAGVAGPVSVVCGAWNFAEGDRVPLAPVGTVLPNGMAIGQRKMKGVESNGMLCSPPELGLTGDGEGLLVLDGDAPPGTPIADALGIVPDVVLELEVNANRPDASSILGVARDVAAKLELPLIVPPVPGAPEGSTPVDDLASVSVEDTEVCGRFVARVLTGVEIGPSPPWLAGRLTAAGMRPINNVVDASNYVMLELGIPNHTYDLARLPGRGLRVRAAHDGEVLVTLDDVERRFTAGDCLICDAKDAPVGIAGIMGGASSEIGESTTEVLLEAAWWTPIAIARTSKRLGLRTEASARFERGTDPEAVDRAVARFCELLAAGGAVAAPGVIDVRTPALPEPVVVRTRTARVNGLLGTALTDGEVRGLLEPLGFGTTPVEAGVHDVEIPSWRPDSALEVDVVEEVARLHGYSRIPRAVPRSPQTGALTPLQRRRRRVRDVLQGTGCSEAWTPTFLAPSALERVGLDPADAVVVTNPLVAEEPLLRTSLLPGLLGAVAANAARRQHGVSLFEVGHVFRQPAPGGRLPDERTAVAVARSGREAPAAVEVWWALVEALGVPGASLEGGTAPGLHPSRTAVLRVGEEAIGVVGEVDPDVAIGAGVPERVAWIELDLDRLLAAAGEEARYRPISRYPSSDVDLAFEVDEGVPAAAVEQALRSADGDLLADVALFDVYRGEPVPAGRRSLAYRIRFQAMDRTLTDAEVAAARARLVDAVESTVPATLRG
ncbi:MAG TPA: phenylalanine--tRNA ligase subunit beta [Acidimicrobiales bacterium]|nr:phenylalanine--tRNA ligase subunit beta [Acidimicrobiales bacterium]